LILLKYKTIDPIVLIDELDKISKHNKEKKLYRYINSFDRFYN
jgi:GTP-binding protein EngB required for normal cell division